MRRSVDNYLAIDIPPDLLRPGVALRCCLAGTECQRRAAEFEGAKSHRQELPDSLKS